jgi:hypothetical protein
MRPLPYKFANGSTVLGHYSVAQRSGAIAATPSAGDVWARIRWAPSNGNAKLVLTRLPITAAVQTVLQAQIGRAFTVDFDTAITNISMAGHGGKMHTGMGTSLMGATGPGICTTAPCTGMTYTLDAAPFALATFPNPSPTLGAAAVTNQVGCGTEMKDLYNWEQMGGHPPTLSSLEGIVVKTTLAGHATGTIAFHAEWSWAEVINPFGND